MKTLNIVLLLIVLAAISCTYEKKESQEQPIKESKSLNREYLMAVLDTINSNEQEPIRQRDNMMEKHGVDSKEAQEYQEIYKRNHAVNEKKVTALLDEYGWLGSDIIGDQGNTTLFLVVQHSDFETRT